MSERFREAVFVLLVAAIAGAGIAYDVVTDDPDPVRADRRAVEFAARSVFCPPTVGDRNARTVVAVAAGQQSPSVGFEPADPEPRPLEAHSMILAESDAEAPVDVVSYGAPVYSSALTTTTRPGSGVGATGCARAPAARWWFAAGSASLDADQRILVYNPFPSEAVVRMTFFTRRGEQTRTSLADVPVPAQTWREFGINEFIQVRRSVGVEVTAMRGRVVAWRELFRGGREGPPGLEFSLGAARAATEWFFPEGAVGRGIGESLSILNPGTDEAVVSVTLVTADEALSPPDLVEFPVPPRSLRTVVLDESAGIEGEGLVSAAVTSANGVEVVVERTVAQRGDALTGTAAEPGATESATRWMVPPAAIAPDADFVTIMNPSPEGVTVAISLLGENGPARRPEELGAIRVPATGRVRVAVERWTRRRPVAALVESSGAVVAERFAYSPNPADTSSVMGWPVTTPP